MVATSQSTVQWLMMGWRNVVSVGATIYCNRVIVSLSIKFPNTESSKASLDHMVDLSVHQSRLCQLRDLSRTKLEYSLVGESILRVKRIRLPGNAGTLWPGLLCQPARLRTSPLRGWTSRRNWELELGHVSADLHPLYHTWPSSVLHILGPPLSQHGYILDHEAPLRASPLMELKRVAQRDCCRWYHRSQLDNC